MFGIILASTDLIFLLTPTFKLLSCLALKKSIVVLFLTKFLISEQTLLCSNFSSQSWCCKREFEFCLNIKSLVLSTKYLINYIFYWKISLKPVLVYNKMRMNATIKRSLFYESDKKNWCFNFWW